MASTEQLDSLHANGVHRYCRRARPGASDGTWRGCPRAGTVERLHGHDYDGPLLCGCTELAS